MARKKDEATRDKAVTPKDEAATSGDSPPLSDAGEAPGPDGDKAPEPAATRVEEDAAETGAAPTDGPEPGASAEREPAGAAWPEPEPAPEPAASSEPEATAMTEPEPAEGREAAEPAPEPTAEVSAPVEDPDAGSVAPPAMAAAPHRDAAAEPHDENVHAEDDHHDYESGPSFASRALWTLLFLLGGAVLGLWAAPKIAPVLPSGMAPVAAWLTPGQDADEARMAEVEGGLRDEIAALRAEVADQGDSGETEARITAALDAAEARSDETLAELQARIDDIDGAGTRQRLGRLEAAIQGQSAEFATLKEQLGGIAASSEQGEQAAAQIDVYRAELDGLRAELGTLSDMVNGLSARIDEVAATADRSIEAAQARVAEIEAESSTALDAAAVAADIAAIRAALAAGQPFAEAVERLQGDPDTALPAALTAAATTGAPTLVELQDRFPDAAHAAIRASIRADAGEGLIGRAGAFFEAQLASRSLTPREGADADAVLSRMEDHLRRGALRETLTEAERLPPEAAAAMQDWLDDARLRADAQDALGALQPGLSATN